jgi:hypothetical protein
VGRLPAHFGDQVGHGNADVRALDAIHAVGEFDVVGRGFQALGCQQRALADDFQRPQLERAAELLHGA